MTHTLLIRTHSLDHNTLAVECTCGNFYESVRYETKTVEHGEYYGVPLSALMDMAEAHQHAEDAYNGII